VLSFEKRSLPVKSGPEDAMRERLIGIDAGGTMTKAALFDLDGG
jgi:activator of 2-hydroxyglutaryl-CoA dehydratase